MWAWHVANVGGRTSIRCRNREPSMVPINTVPYYDAAKLLNISFSSLFQVSTCHRIKGCQAQDYLTWQVGEGRSGLSVMTNRHTTILIDKLTRINRSLKIDFLGEAQVSQFTAMLKAIYIHNKTWILPKMPHDWWDRLPWWSAPSSPSYQLGRWPKMASSPGPHGPKLPLHFKTRIY